MQLIRGIEPRVGFVRTRQATIMNACMFGIFAPGIIYFYFCMLSFVYDYSCVCGTYVCMLRFGIFVLALWLYCTLHSFSFVFFVIRAGTRYMLFVRCPEFHENRRFVVGGVSRDFSPSRLGCCQRLPLKQSVLFCP